MKTIFSRINHIYYTTSKLLVTGILIFIAAFAYGDRTFYIRYAYTDPAEEVLEAILNSDGNYYIDGRDLVPNYEIFKEKLSHVSIDRSFPCVDLLIDVDKVDTNVSLALLKWCQWSDIIKLPYRIILISNNDRQKIRFNTVHKPNHLYIKDWNKILFKEGKSETLLPLDGIDAVIEKV